MWFIPDAKIRRDHNIDYIKEYCETLENNYKMLKDGEIEYIELKIMVESMPEEPEIVENNFYEQYLQDKLKNQSEMPEEAKEDPNLIQAQAVREVKNVQVQPNNQEVAQNGEGNSHQKPAEESNKAHSEFNSNNRLFINPQVDDLMKVKDEDRQDDDHIPQFKFEDSDCEKDPNNHEDEMEEIGDYQRKRIQSENRLDGVRIEPVSFVDPSSSNNRDKNNKIVTEKLRSPQPSSRFNSFDIRGNEDAQGTQDRGQFKIPEQQFSNSSDRMSNSRYPENHSKNESSKRLSKMVNEPSYQSREEEMGDKIPSDDKSNRGKQQFSRHRENRISIDSFEPKIAVRINPKQVSRLPANITKHQEKDLGVSGGLKFEPYTPERFSLETPKNPHEVDGYIDKVKKENIGMNAAIEKMNKQIGAYKSESGVNNPEEILQNLTKVEKTVAQQQSKYGANLEDLTNPSLQVYSIPKQALLSVVHRNIERKYGETAKKVLFDDQRNSYSVVC